MTMTSLAESGRQPPEDPKRADRTPKSLLDFFDFLNQLNEVERQGWKDRGIEKPESVAGHSFLVAIRTMFEAERRGLDTLKATKMALIHDLPEAIGGDIPPHQLLPVEQRKEALNRWIPPPAEALKEKTAKEEAALKTIIRRLPSEIRVEISSLWHEYNTGVTEEAKLVKRMDIAQRLSQARRYRSITGASFPFDPFLQEALTSGDPEIRRLAKAIKKGLLAESV